MRINSNRLLAAAIVGLLSGSTSAFATNGSFMIGFGAGSLGMGGVGVTSPQDSMCVGGNPACLGEFIQPQFDMGAGLFRPPRRASTTVMSSTRPEGAPPGSPAQWQDSEVNLYLMPAMGFVWPFDDQLTVGFAALPAGGGGVTYKPNFLSGSNYLGTDLVQLIVPLTASYKVNETHTVGASIVPARQRFLAQGLEAFDAPGFTANQGYVTNNGHDFANGLGARIGWMGYYFDKRITLGATYATKVYMQKFEHYRGLFAERGSFDIPANYAFGIGVKPVENLTVALDVETIQYSDVPAFANRGPDQTELNIEPTLKVPDWGWSMGQGLAGKIKSFTSWVWHTSPLITGLSGWVSITEKCRLIRNNSCSHCLHRQRRKNITQRALPTTWASNPSWVLAVKVW